MSSQISLARKCATGVIYASDENGDAFRSPQETITIPTVNQINPALTRRESFLPLSVPIVFFSSV
jgi:hypothetical protein